MRNVLFAIAALIFVGIASMVARAQTSPVYKDPSAPVDKRVNDLLSKMTLDEKIDMIGGVDGFYIRPNERLGIPKIKMSDGPLGVRTWGKATAFPAGISFAASWDQNLTVQYGEAIGKEARARGVHIMLSPGVNIYRAPMCGRNFEYYGEDPWLAGRMAAAYITGVQSQGVVATVKHFAVNNQEYDRHNVSSDLDERTLREIYLPTFRAAVEEGHVGAVMNSYNLVNGVHASENAHLLTEILKKDWNFDGLVMSDWGSTYDGVAAANAGLDLEMPSGKFMNRETLLPAIKAGKVSEATINDKVKRLLTVMFRFGFFDRPQADPSLPLYSPESSSLALQAAREGIVLLKNQGDVLPLDRNKIRSIAVLGPNAHPAVTGGGGSSIVTPFRSVSALDGIIAAASSKVKVFYSAGAGADFESISRTSEFRTKERGKSEVQGLCGEYFANSTLSGAPKLTRIDRHIRFDWGESAPTPELPDDDFSIRWTGSIRPESDGDYEFFVQGDDGFRLFVDGRKVLDEWRKQAATLRSAKLPLKAGTEVQVRLEYFEATGAAQIQLGWRKVPDEQNSEAVRLAATSDIAVVCVGFNASTEGEGFDRPFDLPEDQEDLIKAAAHVNPKTIVILTAGGNVAMGGWLGDVKGVLHTWYPGQEGGTAIGEILFGDVNPSGKLPVTFEKRWEDNATFNSYYAKDKKVQFSEGVFLGYRHFDQDRLVPQFAFGFGMSYTVYEYNNLVVTPETKAADPEVTVEFELTNAGERAGAEVAQVYVEEMNPAVPRPPKELKGFERVFLNAHESRKVSITLDRKAFEYYDVSRKAWTVKPGKFAVRVGSSSRSIRFSREVLLSK